ncbi:MAG: hypothetical protein JNM17_20285 [Archangium sp.]|nr:hypothetical protein [Archangium sp.]
MSAGTPFAEAVSMHRAGATTLAIRDRLRALGLDEEAVALLLAAVGARASDAPAPEAEWGPTPAPLSAAPEPLAPVAPSVDAPPVTFATTCARCGVFLTGTSSALVLATAYCTTCAARPDVNYPRAFRDAHWGKRDGWAWFFGALSPFIILAGVFGLLNGPSVTGLLVSFTGIAWAMFWTGAQAGRIALVLAAVVGATYNVVSGIFPNLFVIVCTALAMTNTRTKLFFEIEVSEAELAKAWLNVHANRFAQWARGFGIVSLISFLAWLGTLWAAVATTSFGAIAVVLGVIGLRTVNEQAQPPIGGKRSAVVGLTCGAISALLGAIGLLFATKLLS